MWHLIKPIVNLLHFAMDVPASANAFRDLNTAATTIAANRNLVEEGGVQRGEQIVISEATTASAQLDKLALQVDFHDNPELATAKTLMDKVKSGNRLSPADVDRLMAAMQSVEAKLLKPVKEAIAADMEQALAGDGKIDAQEEHAIEAKYKRLGVEVDVLNPDELRAMGQNPNLVAFNIKSAGPQTTAPVQTFSQSFTETQPGVPPVKQPEYQPPPKAATVVKYWDDARHDVLKQSPTSFIRPEGGIHVAGLPGQDEKVIDKLPDGSPVPTLQNAIKDDFRDIRGKFTDPQDLQAAVKAGYGKDISREDAATLFSFIENGKPTAGGAAPTEADVGNLQRILGSLKADYDESVKQNGAYDKKYGYATTETVRKMGVLLGSVEKKELEGTPPTSRLFEVVGFDQHTSTPSWQPTKDTRFVIDTSGSMKSKSDNLFRLIDRTLGVSGFDRLLGRQESSKDHVAGKFGEGDGTMAVSQSGNLTDMHNLGNSQARKEQVNRAIGDAFTMMVGSPPATAKLQQFADMFGVGLDQLNACIKDGKLVVTSSTPGVATFRDLIHDPSNTGQESPLKSALLTLMTSDEYAAPNPDGTKKELCVVTDEPEHSSQYLDLVKYIAEQKGVSVKIIALPTNMDREGHARNERGDDLTEKAQRNLDEQVSKKQQIEQQLAGNVTPAQKQTLLNRLDDANQRVLRAQTEVQQKSIVVIDLETMNGNYVRAHSTLKDSGPEFKWTDSQETMGALLGN